MKSFLKVSVLALLLCALTGIVASAKETAKVKKVTVTLGEKVTVKGTALKPGVYQVNFDEQSGELKIKKDGTVVATAKARFEKRESKARSTAVTTQAQGENNELVSFSIGGEDQDIVLAQD
jgi:hypothetical protein